MRAMVLIFPAQNFVLLRPQWRTQTPRNRLSVPPYSYSNFICQAVDCPTRQCRRLSPQWPNGRKHIFKDRAVEFGGLIQVGYILE